MENNQLAIDIIKKFEGFRSTPYLCPAGKYTIGYGFTDDVEPNSYMTEIEAEKKLNIILNILRSLILDLIKIEINNNQLNALLSFVFNLGIGTFKKSSVLTKINKKDFNGAARTMLLYNRANGEVLLGLSRRRNAEKELFLKPIKGK